MYWASLIPEENFLLFYNLIFLSVVFLASLIVASLQLDLGGLLLLYHGSRGHHSRGKTRSLASSYICGSMVMQFLILGSCAVVYQLIYSVISFFHPVLSLSDEFFSASAGLLISLALVSWLFYYRSARSTELWLPSSVSNFLRRKFSEVSTRIEAFSLGLLTVFFELPFIFVPAFLAYNSLLSLPSNIIIFGVTLYLLMSILPLLICRLYLKKGANIANVQRWREKNHRFFRILTGIFYFILAIFIIVFIIMGELV